MPLRQTRRIWTDRSHPVVTPLKDSHSKRVKSTPGQQGLRQGQGYALRIRPGRGLAAAALQRKRGARP